MTSKGNRVDADGFRGLRHSTIERQETVRSGTQRQGDVERVERERKP